MAASIVRSKNSKSFTQAEAAHIERVKSLACGLCDAPGPSFAHHIKQGQHWTVIPLCYECHQGKDGWHGTKVLWRIYRKDELDVLADTIQRLAA